KRPSSRTAKGFFMTNSHNPSEHTIYYARSGFLNMDGQSITLKDGEIHKKSSTSPNISIIKFDSYIIDMAPLLSAVQKPKIKAEDRDLYFLFNPNLEDPQYKDTVEEHRAELHKRLTQWLFPIIFGLISIATIGGSTSPRHSAKIHPTIKALAVSLGFFVCFSHIIYSIGKNSFYIPLLYIFLSCTFGVLTFLISRGTTRI
ncbi:LptF/LptG family permease, partial [Candidatus Liberibacter sp.]|uniref:LptF/LptG family permease n=1 Tax=Candidatus Liberibacter sp. TaxID=34022 RepID=UPI0015F773DB